MDKRYYYLGADRVAPKGPHTREELSGMLLRGELLPTTEVAAEGDMRWLPLGRLLMESRAGTPSPPRAEVPANSGEALPPVPGFPTGAMPAVPMPPVPCPTPNMLESVRQALVRTFCWRGRARRAEFWYSWLFYLMVTFALVMLCMLCLVHGLADGGRSIKIEDLSVGALLQARELLPFWIALGIYILWTLWMCVTFLTLTVRRLHDAGHSGLWVLASVLCSLSWQALYLRRVAEIVGATNWKLLLAIEDKASRDARIEEVTEQINLAAYEGWAGGLYLLSMAVGIVILIFALADSEPGSNKYGESPKYPQQ